MSGQPTPLQLSGQQRALYEALSEKDGRLAGMYLGLMAEGDVAGWRLRGWREHARTILATAIQATDIRAREAAMDLVHRLGARGYFEFRNLLP